MSLLASPTEILDLLLLPRFIYALFDYVSLFKIFKVVFFIKQTYNYSNRNTNIYSVQIYVLSNVALCICNITSIILFAML